MQREIEPMRTPDRRRYIDLLKDIYVSQKKDHGVLAPIQKELVRQIADELKYEMRQERKAS